MAIILLGSFIAFGTAYTAMSNSNEMLTDAKAQQEERLLDQQNTAIKIETATADRINVTNTGATDLRVDTTVVVVNANRYEDLSEFDTTIYGPEETAHTGTDLWLTGETLSIQDNNGKITTGDRVTIITDNGIADTAEVS